jgi:hypothetical protein
MTAPLTSASPDAPSRASLGSSTGSGIPAPETQPAKPQIFTAWSNNCRGSCDDQLYIGHAWIAGPRTLCGARIQEIGEPVTPEEIGCAKCKRSKLLKRPDSEAQDSPNAKLSDAGGEP